MSITTRIATASVLTILSGTAMAADLPARVAPPAYAPPLPVFTWTGPYFGINVGYAFDNADRFTTTGLAPANVAALTSGVRPSTAKVTTDGFTGGGQIGYNWQFGAGSGLVVGIEADAAYTDLSKTQNIPGTTAATNLYKSNLDYLGTIRGRVGYAFNQFLIYGTGGFAYGGATQSVTFNNLANTAALYSGTKDDFKTGYAYGGGVEYALPAGSFLNFGRPGAVTIKAEYLHYDLGSSTVAVAPVAAAPGGFTSKVKTDGNLARIGLNYKF